MSTLNDKYIAETFDGLLHAGGEPLPASGKTPIYDGLGNRSALSLGRDAMGVDINGLTTLSALNVQSMEYPRTQSLTGKGIVAQTAINKLEILDTLPPTYLSDLVPTTEGVYSGYISSLTVNSKGLVTSVTASNFPSSPSLPTTTIAKAFAEIRHDGAFNLSNAQTLTVEGYNCDSVIWLKKGIYRAYFQTPMTNSRYTVVLTNALPDSATGTVQNIWVNTNVLGIGYKTPEFFEFYSWQVGNFAENISSASFIVFSAV